MDYSKVLVPKHWGKEYLIYSNPLCEIWLLHIKGGESTSMHTHPDKKTALAVISGKVKVSFLTGGFDIVPPQKINIRPGVFHQTECLSDDGALVLELESPPDKANLVRMRDRYGRVGQGYETETKPREDFSENLELGKVTQIGDCSLEMFDLQEEMLNSDSPLFNFQSLFIVDGQLECNNFPVMKVGDATDPVILSQLIEEFGYKPLKIVGIKRC